MILTCPQCSTRYHVDPASLGAAGRTVRCASCGNRWLAKPPSDTPKVVELAPAGTATIPRMWPAAVADAARGRGSASLVGWLAGVLVLLVLASAVIGRHEIAAGFPASAGIYQALGLITTQPGLQFEEVTSKRIEEGGVAVLVVEGAIVNHSEEQRRVPPIRITLLDGGGRRLQQELFSAKDAALAAGARTSFSGRLINPAEQARNYSVTFEIDS
jgi:predicted Zn finger-like uncharacterized protein